MSLSSFFNDPFFTEFDRLFDEAFDRRTGNNQLQRQSDTANNAPRVLRPRYAFTWFVFLFILDAF